MTRYAIEISPQAIEDIKNLSNAISYEYKSFNTAKRYIDGLFKAIRGLHNSAESYQLQTRSYFLRYGLFVYRINYKKMAIIYTVHNELVVIQRIVASSLIFGD